MEQAGPAISRLDILLSDSRVRDIVGQSKSSIDFGRILERGQIVLLSRAPNIDPSIKNLIGTIVLSEFLYAVYERAKLSEAERTYFAMYCDEFQEFATPDFARLFTQTGKFGVMPVVAHQTREQFKSRDDPNRGATAVSPNKVFFTLSPYDANEMPLVFAKEPPTETRREEQYAISQNPVHDLLQRGHIDPDIRRFVNKYLRYLDDKRDDIKAEMEGEKFARMIELDTAAIVGAEAQGEGIAGPSHYAAQAGAVASRQTALLRARMHSIKLAALHEHGNLLRVTMRGLNRFLTEVMEGARRVKQEEFSDFLINLASSYSALPEEYAQVLGLYIKVSYGDPLIPRTIPFDLAMSHWLFTGEVFTLTVQAQRKTDEERRQFKERFMREEVEDRAQRRKWEREAKPRDRLSAMEGRITLMNRRLGDIRGGKTGTRGDDMMRREDLLWYPANVYTWCG